MVPLVVTPPERCGGLLIRAFALAADAFILSILLVPLFLLLSWGFDLALSRRVLDPAGVTFDRMHQQLALIRSALALGVPLLYFVLLEWLGGGTLGKRLVGLRVRRGNGEGIGLLRALWRNLLKPLSAAPCLLGLLVVPFLPRKQALHDLLSGTVVARR